MKNRVSLFLTTLFTTLILSVSPASFAEDASTTSSVAPTTSTIAAVPLPTAENQVPVSPDEMTKRVDNPYGLEALWKEGDFIARGTLFILTIMSMGSWYILITKLFDQFRLNRQANEAKKTFWNAESVQAGLTGLKEGSPFRFLAEAASKASEHHEGLLLEKINLNEWVAMSIQRAVDKINSRLQDGLAFLATVGSTAPFVGLFGTVWGIYGALTRIGIAGQASIDKVAGPVGEALIMTAFGLFVAVPAVLGYNFLVRRNKSAMEYVRTFGADLHLVLISGAMGASEGSRVNVKKRVKTCR